ncbi:MAG: MFS transporter [Bacteroidia bacterium]|nr:MFS transporter [Bacteroidia bacterium]
MTNKLSISNNNNPFNAIVVVAALGYFVDIYDLILFGIVRNPSLQDLNFVGTEITNKGLFLLNCQMFGMLIGGVLWGVLGDIKGRVSVLFGSIIMYSAANIANGFVTDFDTYAFLRFIAGVGLAGELGAGITLVSETMSKESRGWGTMIIATFGALGAVLASVVGDMFTWRIAYFVGGGLGLLLLLLRFATYESGMFEQVKQSVIRRGAFQTLFTNTIKFKKYIACIAVGLPVWFTVGILIILSPEFGKEMQVQGTVSAGKAIMWCYLGLSIGDLLSGYLSQKLKSRKQAVILFLIFTLVGYILFMIASGISLTNFLGLCFLLGFGTGYWALFVTISSEQFGTNIRATVTTTVPNFVRGSLLPISAAFAYLKNVLPMMHAAMLVGFICLLSAFIAIIYLPETFGKDLDYIEEE